MVEISTKPNQPAVRMDEIGVEENKTRTIDDFKHQLYRGFSRPKLFHVDFPSLNNCEIVYYRLSCFQAQIPGNNIATTEKDIGFRSVPYQKIFLDVIFGFYVSEDLKELDFWQQWIDHIVNKKTNHFTLPIKYQKDVVIRKIDRQQHLAASWTLHEAYPKQIDPISLDFGSNDTILTANVTMAYRHYTHEYEHKKNQSDYQPKSILDFSKESGFFDSFRTEEPKTESDILRENGIRRGFGRNRRRGNTGGAINTVPEPSILT